MANDLFGGLGGLVKGISGLMPQDDPKVKLFNVQTELNDAKKQETEQLAVIGKMAIETYGLESFGSAGEKLTLIRANLADLQGQVDDAKKEQTAVEEEERKEQAQRTCPECGTFNEPGTKFCTECGTKLGVLAPRMCPSCGATLEPGVRFCGECGQRLEE